MIAFDVTCSDNSLVAYPDSHRSSKVFRHPSDGPDLGRQKHPPDVTIYASF